MLDQQTQAMANHAAHGTLTNIQGQLEAIGPLASQTSEGEAEYLRLKRVVESVVNRIRSCDPILLSPQAMDGILTVGQQVAGSLASFQANQNPAHLAGANQQANSFLVYVSQLPPGEAKGAKKAALQFLAEYATATEQQFQQVKDHAAAGLSKVEDLTKQLGDLGKEVETLRQGNSALLERLEKRYAEEEVSRAESLTKGLDSYKATVDDSLESWKGDFDQLKESLNTQAEGVIAAMNSYKEQAAHLAELTGTIARANAYRETARSAGRRAFWWSIGALMSLGALAAIALYTLYSFVHDGHSVTAFDWSGFSIRLYVLAALSALAFYAGREADIHRNSEQRNRRLYSDLGTIDSFLAGLTDEKRAEVKEKVALRIFGHSEEAVDPLKQPMTMANEWGQKAMEVTLKLADKATDKMGK